MHSSCGRLLRLEIIFFFIYSVCSTLKFILHVPLWFCVCVCVCSSIDADTENQNFLFTDWRGGWVGPRKY